MTPDPGASKLLDDRLAAARDAILSPEERVVAQEEGDQGQAIVLTDSRILIIKVGIAAAGAADAQVIGNFLLTAVERVTLRKGPLGAVIHVVTADKTVPARSLPADNVVAFTGSAKVRRCEAIAAHIESVLGRPIGRVSADAARSDESTLPHAAPLGQVRAEQNAAELDSTDEAAEQLPPAETESERYAPNPNLPKPARRGTGPMVKALVLAGLLVAALIVSVGTTRFTRNTTEQAEPVIDVNALAANAAVIRKRLAEVESYRSRVTQVLEPCTIAISRLAAVARSGSRDSIKSALCEDTVDQCWRKINQIEPPLGLAEAKESLVAGVFAFKTAVTNLAATIGSSAHLDPQRAVDSIEEGQRRIARGLLLVDKAAIDLDRQRARS